MPLSIESKLRERTKKKTNNITEQHSTTSFNDLFCSCGKRLAISDDAIITTSISINDAAFEFFAKDIVTMCAAQME